MADSDLSSSASSLLCFEDGEPCVSHGTQLFDMADLYNSCFVLEDDDEEFIQLLVQKETLFGSKNGVFSDVGSYQNQTWLRSARLDAIQWMFNVCFSLQNSLSFWFFPLILGFLCFCYWLAVFTEKSNVWVPFPYSLSFCGLL